MSGSSTLGIKSIRDLEITGKTVFMRLDFNVPLSSPDPSSGERRVEDDSRIAESLPTIKYAHREGAKLILASPPGKTRWKKEP